jgi:hypothetical protein
MYSNAKQRNAASNNRRAMAKKHTSRLRNIAEADDAFKDDLEEFTNFMVGNRPSRRNKGRGGDAKSMT